MPVKTPSFWYKPPGIISTALTPLAWLYQIGHRTNQALKGKTYKSTISVICIGNAVAGGSGKTPTAIRLLNFIKDNDLATNPAFLTRGYGGEIERATFVDIKKHSAAQVGDEALLLAQQAKTIVSQNRKDGAKLAEENNIDLIIMDDGLQNNALHKDISFLVIDRAVDFGNSKTIPAGPLREPLSRILPKTNAVICIGNALTSDKPVFEARINASGDVTKENYVAFAGLGRPEKFLATLQEMNANVLKWYPFPDHHLYSLYEIQTLLKKAEENEATLITTEKDHVRLPKEVKDKIKTLPIELEFKDENALLQYLKEHLK